MKKITLFSLAFLTAATFTWAQEELPEQGQEIGTAVTKGVRQHSESKAMLKTEWFNFWNELSLQGLDLSQFRSALFPDSAVLYRNGPTNFDYVFKHSYGQSLDPTSIDFFTKIDPVSDYTVDRIALRYMYMRPQAGPGDTLHIAIFTENQLNINPSPNWSTPRSYAAAPFDVVAKRGQNPAMEINYVLEDKDVNDDGFDTLYFDVNMSVPAGQIIAATFTYFPGSPWAADDTLAYDEGPYGQGVINAFHIYDGSDNTARFEDDVYNMGQWVDQEILYNDTANTNGWEGQYIPGQAFGNIGGVVRHMNVGFELTWDDFTGISFTDETYSFKSYPNPVQDFLTFEHKMNAGDQAKITVVNILGKEVAEHTINSGLERSIFDVSTYESGIYFANFVVNDQLVATSKFIKE